MEPNYLVFCRIVSTASCVGSNMSCSAMNLYALKTKRFQKKIYSSSKFLFHKTKIDPHKVNYIPRRKACVKHKINGHYGHIPNMNPVKLSESIWNIGQLDAGKRSAKTGRGYKMRAGAEGFKKGKVS